MGAGVNLSEETARIMASSDLAGSNTQSCEDKTVIKQEVLQQLMTRLAAKKAGILHIHADAVKYLACAMEQRVKDIVEKLSSVVTHRHINFKEDIHHEACSDVKNQLKFLQELNQIEKRKHDEEEREILLKVAKSRSKNDNPEQLRLKEKAKLMQQQESNMQQQKNANQTALNAIGKRKKPRLDGLQSSRSGGLSISSTSRKIARPRMKRANLRDFVFVMENEKSFRKSKVLFGQFVNTSK